MGQMEIKCIFNLGKKHISILAKVTLVSDVANGPLFHIALQLYMA
jgi:hypothetical protein